MRKCFACGRKLGVNPYHVDTGDAQVVTAGIECYRLIKAAGEMGYQPPSGGPRLYLARFSPDGTLVSSLAPRPSLGHKIVLPESGDY